MCKKMSKCKYPSCLQILHSSSTLFHHRAFFRGRVYIIRLRFDIYSSHHLSFGHTSPQLVDHGIYELAQKMNMMIVLISPIFIIYHCIVCLYIPHSTGVWYFGKTSASKSTCQCFVLSSVQKHSQICLHSNV